MNKEEGSTSVNNSLINFLKILFSYNSNVLLAALVFLLLVVVFVLLLHFYARFYLSPSHQDLSLSRRRRRIRRRNRIRTVTTTRIPSIPLGGLDGGVLSSPAAAVTSEDKGLDLSVISSIPLFVYDDDDDDEEGECVICLGLWEVGDFGRRLRNCGHGFHLECIDMWLSSHSTCPLCRSPVLSASSDEDKLKLAVNCVQEEEEEEIEVRDGVGEGDVRIDVLDEEINGGGSRSDRRSMSMTSSATSSLMRMLSCSSSSTRSERNKVFPSTTQDSS